VGYILGVVVVGFIFVSLHYFTELSKTYKISITSILLIVIFSAIAFNTYSNKQSQKLLETVKKFNQNKTIKCGKIDVNQSTFSLSVGTFTFIGKENTPYFEEMISASSCQ
jgi:cytochrome c biogenesis factor